MATAPSGAQRRRRTWPQRLLITFNVALVVGALVAASGLGYVNYKFGQVPRISLSRVLEPTDAGVTGEAQNILLIGTDSAAGLAPDDPIAVGRADLGELSDTIIVMRADPNTNDAQMLSLPRDLFVPIAGGGEQRINAALSIGGPEALIQTITDVFDIPINHYVEVDFVGFKELVGAVGGVEMYFENPVRDDAANLFIPRTGCLILDGDQALAFARSRAFEEKIDGVWRTDPTGDLGRIKRQQKFVERAVQQAVAKGFTNPATLSRLVDVGIETLTLDDTLTARELLDLGFQFRNFSGDALTTYDLDVIDDNVAGAAVLRLDDTERNDATIAIFQGVSAGDLVPSSVRVEVLNGNGGAGIATTVAGDLDAAGFNLAGSADADRFDYARTEVRYVAGDEAAADFLARQLAAGADLVEVSELVGVDVSLVVGLDYAGLRDEPLPAPEPAAEVPAPAPAPESSGDAAEAGDPETTTTTQLANVVGDPPPGVSCG